MPLNIWLDKFESALQQSSPVRDLSSVEISFLAIQTTDGKGLVNRNPNSQWSIILGYRRLSVKFLLENQNDDPMALSS